MEDCLRRSVWKGQAIWNSTKGLNSWNKKSFNTWGVHAMYSADGFLKSMTAITGSRFKAYDKLVAEWCAG